MLWPWRGSTDDPHIGSRPAKKAFQNIRLGVVASITPKSGANRHRSSMYVRCRACAAEHCRLGLSDHLKADTA